jgi:hypothetical protein
VFPVRTGVDFVGYVQFPDYRRIRRRSVLDMRRRIRELRAAYQRGQIGPPRVRAAIHSWLGHARHADARGLTRAIFTEARFARG